MIKLPRLPFVLVEWDDAWVVADSPATLIQARAAHRPERLTTVGWVLQDDETGIQVANEFFDDTWRGRTFIPRALVAKVTPFTLTKARAPRGRKASSIQKAPEVPTSTE